MHATRTSHFAAPADILERILDKGIVIDAWAVISLAGHDFRNIEARVVVASIETYLNYAEQLCLTTPQALPLLPIGQFEET